MTNAKAFLVACLAALGLGAFVNAQAPVAGPNRNVVGGPIEWSGTPFASRLKTGDPYGQRQDEISCMVDSRNALVIGCAFNDYTPVELPGLANDGETGDAWIGRAWSTDGGVTWRNALLPGYKQDTSAEGLASPLRGLDAGADPTWRSGPNGRSYLSGIAFNRSGGTQSNGVIFVQTYINNNNVENDSSPLKAAGPPVVIDTGNSGQFQDKSWLAVGPDGAVHVAYATFLGGNKPHSIVWHQVSRDGGKTFSRSKLSEGDKVNNGASIAIHPTTGWVDVSWRRRQSGAETDAIQFARSTDGGQSFTAPGTIVSLPQLQRADGSLVGRAFDQSSGPDFFRNISNPTMTTDTNGRVYVAWAERIDQLTADQNGREIRDSQIKLAVGTAAKASGNQVVWSTPTPIDLLTPGAATTRGHQFRPSLWFAFGKLMLSYMHTRDDDKAMVYHRVDVDDPGRPGAKIATYQEVTELKGDLATNPPNPAKLFTEFIIDRAPASTPTADVAPNFNASLLRRHTQDVIALMGTPAAGTGNALPTFTSTKVSRYAAAFRSNRVEQVQFNVLTRPLHGGGTIAFAGDYDDVVAQAFVPNAAGTGWVPNTAPSTAPGFYVAWTDNRDVRPLAPPTSFSRVGPTCTDPSATGTRNQNPYVARVGNGLYVHSFGNQKPLNTTFGRAFTVLIQNAVNSTKTYRATITQPAVGSASWLQFSSQTTLDLSIPPFSSAARVVYAKSTDAKAPLRVDVVELNAPAGGAPLQSFTIFNPDRSVTLGPALSPDPSIDQTPPANAEIFTPDATSPDATSQNVRTPDATSPDATSPDATSPDATSVSAQFPDATSPDATSPDATSPDATSYPAMTPDATSPDATSTPPIYPTVTDTIHTFANKGNVAGSFALKTFATKPLCAGCKLQVLVMKPSLTPTQRGCEFKNQDTSALVSNIASLTDADLQQGAAFTFNPNDASTKNLTVSVPPGGSLSLVYRLFNPQVLPFTTDSVGRRHSVDPTFDPATDLVPVTIAQSVSSNAVLPPGCPANPEACPTQGTATAPSNTVYLTTTTLADGAYGAAYSETLKAIGGKPPYSWSTSSTLPTGLTLNTSTGQLTGTPTQTGSFSLTFTVTDSALPAHTATRTLSLLVRPSVLIYGPMLWNGTSPTEKTIAEAAGYAVTVKDAGAWSATTTAGFSSFNAIVFPDPHCSDMPTAENPPLYAANVNKATWSPAVTGPKVIVGTDPVWHADPGLPPQTAAPGKLMRNAINFAASGTATGMYMSLSCTYESGVPDVQTVTVLSEFGTFTVTDTQGSNVNVLQPTHPVMFELDNASLSGWSSSIHEWFNSYPEGWTAIAQETSSASPRIYIIAKP